jgi:hypothetical protein
MASSVSCGVTKLVGASPQPAAPSESTTFTSTLVAARFAPSEVAKVVFIGRTAVRRRMFRIAIPGRHDTARRYLLQRVY